MPLTPKALVVDTVPILRSPMPCTPPLPALVLPEMFKQTLSLTDEALPASTRMPSRTPESGAATVLFWIFTLRVPVAPRATVRMPLPSGALMLLPVTVTVMLGVSLDPKVTPVPPPMPFEAAVLLATITLLFTVKVEVVSPLPRRRMAVPCMLVIGFATVPLVETSKFAWPLPATEAVMALPFISLAGLCPLTWLPVIEMTLPVPGVPNVPAGPELLALPPWAMIPPPLGKLEMTLPAIVAVVTFATLPVEPSASSRMPLPFVAAALVELVTVLPEMLALLMVPLKFWMSTPCHRALVSELPVIVTVPETLFSVPATAVLNAMFDVLAPPPVPELSIEPLTKLKLVTVVPLTPLPDVFLMINPVNDGLSVLVKETPSLVVFWIVPPVPAPPPPATVNTPEAPVLLSTMPLAGPEAAVPADTLFHLSPAAPIVVLATLTAVPVVVVTVLVVFVAVTVPPPVAVKPGLAPVDRVSAPVKLIVAPVLLDSEMPLPVSLTVLDRVTVSPVRLDTATELPEVLVIGIPRVTLPLPPLTLKAVPEAPPDSVIEPEETEKAVLPTPPKALTSDTPVVVELVLVSELSGRVTEAPLTSSAGPPTLAIVPTPAPTVIRKPVPAPAFRAPVLLTSRPVPALL